MSGTVAAVGLKRLIINDIQYARKEYEKSNES